MKEVHMKGIITSKGDSLLDKEVFAVMILDTVKGGELYYHIKHCKRFSVATSRLFIRQLASAISHLNKQGYCHRDLKPWNIMMSSDLSSL